ncbi:MAG TPA: FecR family protein [Devosia sp.]|nr:FecR family protein [Devosia sp.]
MRTLPAVAFAIVAAGLPSLAMADGAGSALGVKQAADARLTGVTRTLEVGSDTFIGDLVQTGARGQVQILFNDNTEMVVGPSSQLAIEDYLLRGDGSAGKLAVEVLSGAFRFATGDSAKNRHTIDTPTGAIGVRGTEFDIWVEVDGTTYVLRHGGTVVICNDAGECEVLDETCEVGKIAPGEVAVLGDARQSRGEQRAAFKQWFRYSDNQSPLLRQFWFARARDCLHAVPTDPEDDPSDSNTNNDGGAEDNPQSPDTPVLPETPVITDRTIFN